jgi:hypothetical protein
MGVEREEAAGEGWRLVNNDCGRSRRPAMAADSVDLIVTSIPFSTQYEYSPSTTTSATPTTTPTSGSRWTS